MARSKLVKTAQRFRAELIRQDTAALAEMIRAYGPAEHAIRSQLVSIQSKIEDATAAGETLGRSWLMQQGRARALEAQIQHALAEFAPKATAIVVANQREKVTRARSNSRDLTALALGRRAPTLMAEWNVLPTSALEDLVGFSADGSPLRSLFDALGPQVSRSIRDELATGITLGRNPRVVARGVNSRSGMGLARALTISRTESLRSYREATRRQYDQSSVVEGWLWLSARDITTCAACWGMDGDRFDTGDGMEAHPNCRCTMVPNTGSTEIGNGVDLFDKLSQADQRTVLGPSKHDALRDGKISLKDLVTKRTSADWGTSVQVASLNQALRNG